MENFKKKCDRLFRYSGENGGGESTVEIFVDTDGNEYYQKYDYSGRPVGLVKNAGENLLRTGKDDCHCSVSDCPV
jgi:hypothetical protein